jgi:photosystem II stability/assembly factor-like uncharacterized protein
MPRPQGINLLSQVNIDTDKNWNGYRISNLGSPAARNDALSQGLVNPYYSDYGLNWKDLGVITSSGILSLAYLGNGIVILGSSTSNIYRSTDYGATWNMVVFALATRAVGYLGNGIAIAGNDPGHILRSTDYGAAWADLGAISSAVIRSTAYLGNGIAIFGDQAGHILRSTDYGATWVNLGAISLDRIYAMAYLGNGIAIFGDNTGHVFRSTDYGATWVNLGVTASARIVCMAYLGNGIAILCDMASHNFRSTDYGATWVDIGVFGSGFALAYLGNGIACMGSANGHVWHSTDYGVTWTDIGALTGSSLSSMSYLTNGIAITGSQNGHVYRSTSAFGNDNFFSPYQFDLNLQFGCLGIITPNGTSYLAPGNGATQLNEIKVPVMRSGLLKRLFAWQRVPSGAAGITDIYTVRVNGVNTAITCTLENATAGSDVAHSKLVAAGDLVSVSLVSNSVLDASADVTVMLELT